MADEGEVGGGVQGRGEEDTPQLFRVHTAPKGNMQPEILVDVTPPTGAMGLASGNATSLLGENGSDSPPRNKLSSQSYRDAVAGKTIANRYRSVDCSLKHNIIIAKKDKECTHVICYSKCYSEMLSLITLSSHTRQMCLFTPMIPRPHPATAMHTFKTVYTRL